MIAGPLMLDIEGIALTADDKTLLQHPLVGGLIYFARNFESRAQITALSAEIHALRPELILAVDQEGGRVQRFRDGFVRLPPMQVFGDLYQRDPQAALTAAYECGWLMAAELVACGIDISFAPVLDVDRNASRVIADRAFSEQPHIVATVAAAFVRGMGEAGMVATGKHFPGHGSVAGDSHHEIPVDDRALALIEAHDMVPFRELIAQNLLQGIMPAHVIYPALDTQPAGFSAKWIQDVLRSRLGFDGVIFSDDLTMEGATAVGDMATRARLALQAGCDMLLVCNNRAAALDVLRVLETMDANQFTTRLAHLKARSAVLDVARVQQIQQQMTQWV